MVSLTITLTGNKEVYIPGELISGQVNMSTTSPLNVEAIEVKFCGKGLVHWSEGWSKHTLHYCDREVYLEKVIILFKGNGASLPSKQSIFPFQYQLPPNLPSSFETHHGYVRYSIKCTVRRSGLFYNYKALCCFTILDNLDLNEIPDMLQPVGISDSKTLCCLCCADGPIEADVSTDRSGYVPGEFITVNGNIENMSSKNLSTLKISLLQVITLRATMNSKKMEQLHATREIRGYCRRSKVELSNERFKIPALPPSHLRFCNIIDIQYFLQVCVVIPGPCINLRVNCPIILGSIPLHGLLPYGITPLHPSSESETPNKMSSNKEAIQPGSQSPLHPAYEPVIEYALPKSNDNESTNREETSMPVYYDWKQSAFSYK